MKMCSILSRWLPISLALFATALLVRAESERPILLSDGGLQMSVNTSAYRVHAGDPPSWPTHARTRRGDRRVIAFRDVLVASIHLANRSAQDLTFTFADEAAAKRRFDFRVFDSQGEQVWSGGGSVAQDAAPQATTAVLKKRSKWSSVVRVPLKVNGEWLSPGVYTLEAALAGEPRIGATTLFEVAERKGGTPPPQPPQMGEIKGQVFIPTATNELVPARGANVVVEGLLPADADNLNLRPRVRWTGVTNEEGRFEAKMPAGRFRVAAAWSAPATEDDRRLAEGAPYQINLPLRGSKEVLVTAGQVSEVRLDLKAGLVEIGTRPVYSVSSVKVRFLPTFAPPTMLEVSATGMVNTGGWSQAKLRQRGVTPEGIIEFDFVAKPPDGMATQAFEAISATTNVPQPSNFRGVRVFSQTNSMDGRAGL